MTIPSSTKEIEAAALKQLYGEHTKLSNAAFGREFGLGTAGMVWQYLNAHRPLNLDAATKFASGLGIKIDQFSPRLARTAALGRQVSGTSPSPVAPLVAREPATQYKLDWPFRTITRAEIKHLSTEQCELLESVMRPIIDRALGTSSQSTMRL